MIYNEKINKISYDENDCKSILPVSIIDEYQGKFPVIYLNFNTATAITCKEVELNLRKIVATAYKEHVYLYKKELIELLSIHSETNFTSDSLNKIEQYVSRYNIQIPEEILIFKSLIRFCKPFTR